MASGGPKGQRRMRFNIFLAFIRICFSQGPRPRRSGGEPKPKVRRHSKGSSSWSALGKKLGGGKLGGWFQRWGAQRMEFFSSLLARSYSLLIGLFFSWWSAGGTRHGSAPFSSPWVSPPKGGPPHNFLSPHILIYHTGRLRGDTHRRPPIVTKSNLILGTLNSLPSRLRARCCLDSELC